MLRRLSILVTAAALALAVGGGTAFAGDKAGAVNATSDCLLLQDNFISGEIYVFLHNPSADGWAVSVTYHMTGDVEWGTLVVQNCTAFPGWTLYDTGLTTDEAGAASVAVYDTSETKVGGDSFLAFPPA
jgi:hypothetical protein